MIYAKMTCRCVFRSESYIFGCLLMTVEALMNAVSIERNIAVNTQMASVHEEIEGTRGGMKVREKSGRVGKMER